MARRVLWTRSAQDDLNNTVKDIRVIKDLVNIAEATLHVVEHTDEDEGVLDGVMWHRGITHGQQRQRDEGRLRQRPGPQAWDYFLIYHPIGDSQFRVFAVRGNGEIGGRWMGMHHLA